VALLALVATILLVAALICWWRYDRNSLTAEERDLVGTWVVSWDGRQRTDLKVEYAFRSDRTCRLVNRDPTTGAVVTAGGGYDHWRLDGGRLTLRMRLENGNRWTTLLSGNTQRWGTDVFLVTPNGPDRVQCLFLHSDNPGLTVGGSPHSVFTRSRSGREGVSRRSAKSKLTAFNVAPDLWSR
jgi:hypothetical protein